MKDKKISTQKNANINVMSHLEEQIPEPEVRAEIQDLRKKLAAFRSEEMPEQYFKNFRLGRGIYGQRQKGVQMIRIKLPHGRLNYRQWKRIADISDEYATGNLHLTTRQDIQLHYVSLDRTPELWTKLAEEKITLRGACGNTVRNVTGSATAGVDPDEPFDVTPYAQAAFEYFVRNPICQDMGRKFKIAFSSSAKDTAWSFIHDVGLIPKLREESGQTIRGFKVVVGGGLGAQPYISQKLFDFLEEDKVIPYIEAIIRVFDRYGERTKRNKARMKYLLAKLGMDEFSSLIHQEWKALKNKTYQVDTTEEDIKLPAVNVSLPGFQIKNRLQYEYWLQTNVFEQKQKGWYAAAMRLHLGDIDASVTRRLVQKLHAFTADDIRVTPNQGFLFKYIRKAHLPYIYSVLEEEGLAKAGFDSIADITACPGTDTCNLGISSSTGIAAALEDVIQNEYPELIFNNDIHIKISGCMNSCGQHGIAEIGFHGSSMRSGKKILPALQVLLGGGILGDGDGRKADKVIKVPSKRGTDVLRYLLDDYAANSEEDELFNQYYDRQGNKYFYALLKPLTDLESVTDSDFVDWGRNEDFVPAIGTGECASVIIDLVGSLLTDSEEKLKNASVALEENRFADAIYHAYTSYIHTAKALLLDKDVKCNTQIGILNDFEKNYEADFTFAEGFKEYVLQINKKEPKPEFAEQYIDDAKIFLKQALAFREEAVSEVA